MFSNYYFPVNCLRQFLNHDKTLYRQSSTLLKETPELDDKIYDLINNKHLKVRNHPGIIKSHCVKLPDSIKEAISEVSSSISKKQLLKESESFARYLHSRQLPAEKINLKAKFSSIKEKVEASMNINEELLSAAERDDVNKFVNIRSNYILKQEVYNWQPIVFSRHIGLKYLFSRSAAEYAVIKQILNDINIRGKFEPKSLFDFGSGVGTVMWAANETWGNSIKEYFCADVSKDMNILSEDLINIYNNQLKNKIFYRQFLPTSNPLYDVVVSAYTLMELPSAEARLETVAKLWNKTNRYLILIEHGTMAGFKIIAEARDFILQAVADKENVHIFSPCPHELSCPRLSQDHTPCNFQASYYLHPQKECVKQELYSYVVISKKPRESDDAQWPRIVRPVLCRSRHVICRICRSSGTLQEIIFTPNKHGRIPYRCARTSKWGDRLPINFKESSDNQTEEEAEIE